MQTFKRVVAASALFGAVSVSMLSACHTVEGAGKDIESAGKAIEDAADKD
jgi:predicted small secreted protein